MPRPRRIVIPGIAIHVTQRGNNRGPIFYDDQDRYVFLAYLSRCAVSRGLAIHSFALMRNHYHLLATPSSEAALPRTIQQFGSRYVQYVNRRYQRTGTLWDGRYGSRVVDDDRYFLTCMHYIEHNPVAAGFVDDPSAYRWSSYRAHALGERSAWLVPHPLYESLGSSATERQAAYRAIYDAFTPVDWAIARGDNSIPPDNAAIQLSADGV